jgi:hypothetical protein
MPRAQSTARGARQPPSQIGPSGVNAARPPDTAEHRHSSSTSTQAPGEHSTTPRLSITATPFSSVAQYQFSSASFWQRRCGDSAAAAPHASNTAPARSANLTSRRARCSDSISILLC